MSIIGNSTIAITLSPQNPHVTITGTISGDAPITVQGTGGSYPINTAVQGGPGATFDILNQGYVQGGVAGAGIILAQPGIITNTGIIRGVLGVLIASYQPGAYVDNTGIIGSNADDGEGVVIVGPASVNNAGNISGDKSAIFLYQGGTIRNTGYLLGSIAVSAGYRHTQMYNAGFINGDAHEIGAPEIGVYIRGALTNSAAGSIQAGYLGVYLADGGVLDNAGHIDGNTIGVSIASQSNGFGAIYGATIDNTGAINGSYAALTSTQPGEQTNLDNAASGFIDGTSYGLLLFGAGSSQSIANAGYIGIGAGGGFSQRHSASLAALGAVQAAIVIQQGTVDNTGTISAGDGIFVLSGPGTIVNGSTGTIGNRIDGEVGAGTTAIDLNAGGVLTNAGTIGAGNVFTGPAGVLLQGSAAVFNTGEINAGITAGADSNVYLSNGARAAITDGVTLATGFVVNNGLITATQGAGLTIQAGGIVFNGGTIGGGGPGITINGGGTVSDSGLIAGLNGAYSIDFSPGENNLLILTPSAALKGRAVVNGALSLTAGAGTLTLANFLDVESIHFGAGAHWHLIGTLSPTTAIYNSGTLTNTAGPGLTLAAPVYNYGLISGSTDGIISAGGYVYNAGKIAGGTAGLDLTSPAYVINTGTITGATGVVLAADSQFYNYTGAKITGGVTATTNAYLYNYARATITAQATAISLTSGIAYNAGDLSAANGIILSTGTVTNLGTIEATTYAIDFTTNSPKNRLILAPTALTTGTINLNGGVLELQNGHRATGTIAAAPENLSAITIDSRANWNFTAPQQTIPTLTNNGTLFDQSALTITKALGRGTLVLDSALTLSTAAATQKIAFSPTPETLTLTTPTSFAATIQNFTLSDTIDLATIPLENITGETLHKNILTLTESTTTLTFTFASLPAHDTFALTPDAAGTALTLSAPTTPATLPLTHPLPPSQIPTLTLQP